MYSDFNNPQGLQQQELEEPQSFTTQCVNSVTPFSGNWLTVIALVTVLISFVSSLVNLKTAIINRKRND